MFLTIYYEYNSEGYNIVDNFPMYLFDTKVYNHETKQKSYP